MSYTSFLSKDIPIPETLTTTNNITSNSITKKTNKEIESLSTKENPLSNLLYPKKFLDEKKLKLDVNKEKRNT